MNCSLKSNGHKYKPNSRIHIGVFSFISRAETVSLSHIPENLLKMPNVSSRKNVDCVAKFCQYRRCLSFRMQRDSSYSQGFREHSEVPGSSLPLRVSSYSLPTLHLFAILENSTLRLDCVLSLQVSQYFSNQNDRCPEHPPTFRRSWTWHCRRTCRSMRDKVQRRL